jgi:hypothetical protein
MVARQRHIFWKFIAVAAGFFFENIEKVHEFDRISVFTRETLWEWMNLTNYYQRQNIMNLDIFWISWEWKQLETCGFHYSKEKCGGSEILLNSLDYELVKLVTFYCRFWPAVFQKTFWTKYEFQFSQSIVKIFLCRSTQGWPF